VIALLVRTDGRRECIDRTITSFEEQVSGTVTRRVIHDDSGDPNYTDWLRSCFPGFEVFAARGRQGFAGAIRSAWKHLEGFEEPWVADWEDDFTVTRPVDLDQLVALQQAHPHLAQVCLRRQPWGAEVPHGGFMEMAPQWYTDRSDGRFDWVETTRNWTTNPSVYRKQICQVGWPEGKDSEGHWGFKLRDRGLPWGVPGDQVRFGFWGSRDGGRDWIFHIGDERVGSGY
jgi:hypothetical protein